MSLTEDDVRQRLREFIGDRRQYVVARELGVTAPWLCQLLNGYRRPSGKVLDALGIERLGHGLFYGGELRRGKEKACFRLKGSA